jgi:PilZ domain
MKPGDPEGKRDAEGRREARLAVDLPVQIGGRTTKRGRVVDLSLRGALVRSEVALAAGAVVDLQIDLPGGAFQAKARVAEASIDGESLPGPPARFLTGIEFLSLAAADEQRLRSFLGRESKRRRGAHSLPS